MGLKSYFLKKYSQEKKKHPENVYGGAKLFSGPRREMTPVSFRSSSSRWR